MRGTRAHEYLEFDEAPKPLGLGSKVLGAIAVTLALAMWSLVIVTPLSLEHQALLGGVVFLFAWAFNRVGGRYVTLALMFISLVVSSRYMYWRITATMGGDFSLAGLMGPALLGAEIYTFGVQVLGFLQSAWPLNRRPTPMPEDTDTWPTVDIFIPSYNEPLAVVRSTVLAAKGLDWPVDKLKVYILDDGKRSQFRSFAHSAGVGYITRSDNLHAKAGNINRALEKTHGEYIAIFDCDHVPTRSYLQMMMGWFFRDPKIVMVQAPHHFYSPDPFERNLSNFKKVPNEGNLFYGLLQQGNDLFDATFFCGSCATIRRKELLEVGGIAVETVTEDAHTALKLHRKGYRTAYVPMPQATGLATESLSAHIGQRIRWARGMVQIFRTDNPLLGRGLNIWQRLCYTNAMVHFLNALPRIIFLSAPLAFLFFEARIFNATPLMVVAYAAPHLLHSTMTNSRTQGPYRHTQWAEVYETVLAFYILMPTLVALINPAFGKFNVTAKGGVVEKDYFEGRLVTPLLVLLGMNVVGIVLGTSRFLAGDEQFDSILMNVFWASYNVMVLGAAVAVAWERRQVRQSNRVDVRLPAMVRLANRHTVSCSTIDIGMGGAAVELPTDVELETGDAVSLGLFINDEEFPVPARVIGREGTMVRLGFETLSMPEEERLVRVIFSRINAWTDWEEGQEDDNPLGNVWKIARHSTRAIRRTLRLSGRRKKKDEAA
jgi:cellulose synthase (UDP-forming)